MNVPVKKKQTDLVLDEESAAEAILDESSKGPTPFLKFKKDKYVIGKDTTVPLETQFLAYCADWRRGWVKFFGEEKVDEKVYRVAENRTVLERDELGDLNQSDWETDEDGKAQDPWFPALSAAGRCQDRRALSLRHIQHRRPDRC